MTRDRANQKDNDEATGSFGSITPPSLTQHRDPAMILQLCVFAERHLPSIQ